jgi:hypothetical protein
MIAVQMGDQDAVAADGAQAGGAHAVLRRLAAIDQAPRSVVEAQRLRGDVAIARRLTRGSTEEGDLHGCSPMAWHGRPGPWHVMRKGG